MRRLGLIVAALVAAFFVSGAYAGTVIDKIQLPAQGSFVQPGVGLQVQEQFPDRTMRLIEPVAIQATFIRRLLSPAVQLTGGIRTADSSAAIAVTGYRMLALDFYPTFGDTIAGQGSLGAVFAVEARFTSATGVPDSQGVFIPLERFKSTTTTQPDSIGTFADLTTSNPANFTTSDTLGKSNQLVVVLTNVAGPNRGRRAYLMMRDGTPLRGDFLVVWVRILHAYCNGTGTQANQCVYCEPGGPYVDAAAATARRVRLRVSVVGWL